MNKRPIKPEKFDTPSGDGFLDLDPVDTPDVDIKARLEKELLQKKKRKNRIALIKQIARNLIKDIPYLRAFLPLIKPKNTMSTKKKLPQKSTIAGLLTALAIILGFFGLSIDPETALVHIESIYLAVTALIASAVALYEMFRDEKE